MLYAQSAPSATFAISPTASPAVDAGISRECDRAEELLHEAARDLNDELGIIGLRLGVDRVSAEGDHGARVYLLRCGGEAAPRSNRDATLVIGTEGVRVLVNDAWGRGDRAGPLANVGLETMSDLLLTALEGMTAR